MVPIELPFYTYWIVSIRLNNPCIVFNVFKHRSTSIVLENNCIRGKTRLNIGNVFKIKNIVRFSIGLEYLIKKFLHPYMMEIWGKLGNTTGWRTDPEGDPKNDSCI